MTSDMHRFIFASCISFGLHAVALSGATFLLSKPESTLRAPVEVVLVKFSNPVPDSGNPIPSVVAVQSELPITDLPFRRHKVPEEEKVPEKENAALQKMRMVEAETANDTIPYQVPRFDAANVFAPVEETSAKPSSIVVDNYVSDAGAVYGDQVVTLPADVQSLNLDEMSGLMRPDVQYLSSTPPRYPRLARQRGWEGTVLLEVEVLSSGNVGMIRVVRSSGYKMLDRAATRAVYEWQFSIKQTNGSDITATVEIPVTFTLATHTNPKRRG